MRVRSNIAPRRANDIFCFLLIVLAIPAIFMFEVIVVLPELHATNSFGYWFTYVLAVFLVHNIVGNFLICVMIDTSVDFNKLQLTDKSTEELGWRKCVECKKLAPPRSWHCDACGMCILKRDHHCVFTGCCIGYYNHRYFILFLIYLAIGSIYAFVYNSIYILVLKSHIYMNWMTPVKMICPLLLVMLGNTWQNFYLVFYGLNIIAVLYSVVLLIYHIPIILKGGTSFERDHNCYSYDMGWRKNLLYVFGKRMHLIFLTPFMLSDLPSSETAWPQLQKAKSS